MAASAFGINFNGTLGALGLGTMISSVLYGVTSIQTYTYFQRSGRDPSWLKWSVFCLCCIEGEIRILDTLHQIFICHADYMYTVIHFGNLFALALVDWSIIAEICITVLVTKIAEKTCNFTIRSQCLLRSHLEIIRARICYQRESEVSLGDQFSAFHSFSVDYYVMLIFSIIADLALAGTQVWLLFSRRGQIRSINTGVVTSGRRCRTIWYMQFFMRHLRNILRQTVDADPDLLVLLNALLATLNARQDLREVAKGQAGILSIPLTSVAPSSTTATTHIVQNNSDTEIADTPLEIKVDQTKNVYV
ncbi:hypothetical protein CERSUDRAFT_77447 [Gelatoporia subvermispora B]|uniref:Uncharacterized protein n=1 Tax=Ceriporiopsis subvermispora (strain B) TaxID=914234 RepID=M2R2J2_CERS8|nr:hypothetical protein CERSUDRAFT_77447 [Gelatoporia subvermispora B]